MLLLRLPISTPLVWNFCCWDADVPQHERSPRNSCFRRLLVSLRNDNWGSEVAKKFHTDDVLPFRYASDWMRQIFNQSEALPDLGNDMSFCRKTSDQWVAACSLSVSCSLGISFTGQVKPELQPDWSSSCCFNILIFWQAPTHTHHR